MFAKDPSPMRNPRVMLFSPRIAVVAIALMQCRDMNNAKLINMLGFKRDASIKAFITSAFDEGCAG